MIKIGTIFDYIEWRGDIPLSQVPPGEVDNMIFSQISYVDFDNIVDSDIAGTPISLYSATRKFLMARKKRKDAKLGAILPVDIINMTARAGHTQRFKNVGLVGYVNNISDGDQSQFSAITFLPEDDSCFVAFRGTDDTLVGWKESFNMSFLSPIPSQTAAQEYLNRVADAYPNRHIYLGGHSKGGNLAVYAATKCDDKVQKMIVKVYNNDGPGFDKEFIQSPEYAMIRNRIVTLIPQSSIVGMLLEHEESYTVVKSNHSSGLAQHDGLSWEICGGSFVRMDSVTEKSLRFDRDLKEKIGDLTVEERKKILDVLYELITSTNAKTLTELSSEKLKLLRAWSALDSDTKAFIKKYLKALMSGSKKTNNKKTDGKA